jgi:hypothetical protein
VASEHEENVVHNALSRFDPTYGFAIFMIIPLFTFRPVHGVCVGGD